MQLSCRLDLTRICLTELDENIRINLKVSHSGIERGICGVESRLEANYDSCDLIAVGWI